MFLSRTLLQSKFLSNFIFTSIILIKNYITFCRWSAYPLIAHHFKNCTAMHTTQPKTVKYIKTKFKSLQKVFEQYEKNAEYLGGYRIECRFVCKSLSILIRELKERTFKLEYIRNMISGSRQGEYFDDDEWMPVCCLLSC